MIWIMMVRLPHAPPRPVRSRRSFLCAQSACRRPGLHSRFNAAHGPPLVAVSTRFKSTTAHHVHVCLQESAGHPEFPFSGSPSKPGLSSAILNWEVADLARTLEPASSSGNRRPASGTTIGAGQSVIETIGGTMIKKEVKICSKKWPSPSWNSKGIRR
jgi:hypothetical protein